VGGAGLSIFAVGQCEMKFESSDDIGRQGSYESSIEFRYFAPWDVSVRDRGVKEVAEELREYTQQDWINRPIIQQNTQQPNNLPHLNVFIRQLRL
jgi:hypothetical protein